jgi:hypothetical protein
LFTEASGEPDPFEVNDAGGEELQAEAARAQETRRRRVPVRRSMHA